MKFDPERKLSQYNIAKLSPGELVSYKGIPCIVKSFPKRRDAVTLRLPDNSTLRVTKKELVHRQGLLGQAAKSFRRALRGVSETYEYIFKNERLA